MYLEEALLNYICQFHQKLITKFIYPIKRAFKKRYPSTYRYFGEFGFECLNCVPYAYYLHKKGLLKKTCGAAGTTPLYFFSPRHEERAARRYSLKNYPPLPVNLCNASSWDTQRWAPPPYKEYYANREFIYNKPLLIISNKYNSEWTRPPINFLSVPMLEFIHERFSKKYQIVYSRYTTEDDNSVVYDLGDFDYIKRNFPQTILMQELMVEKGIPWNELQMKLYANCERFISVQGGPSVISSYFGGNNCIYIRKGLELTSGEYEKVYPLLSGCRTHRVSYRKEDLTTEETRFIRAFKVPVIQNSIEEPFKVLLASLF